MSWSVYYVSFILISDLPVLLASPVTSPNLNEDNCSVEEFKCDGFCVPNHWKCDGIIDCDEGKDESDCEIGPTESSSTASTSVTFRSRRTEIIKGDSITTSASTTKPTTPTWRRVCTSTQYQCSDSTCIPQGWRCDGDDDCLMGEDESNCSHGDSTTTSGSTAAPTIPTRRGENSTVTTTTSRSTTDTDTTTDNSRKATTCSSNEFQCSDWHCIPPSWRCDGAEDCFGGEDEENCTNSTEISEGSAETNSSSNTTATTCSSNEFQCSDGKCLPPSWQCDGDKDCFGGEDEENCTTPTCSPGEFQCNDNRCIKSSWLCDHDSDCSEGEDENNCTVPTCQSNEFACNKKDCIRLSWRCDGDEDCRDGEDERNCTATICLSNHFQCNDEKCIRSTWHCDGDEDCLDGEDEQNCPNMTETSTMINETKPTIVPSDMTETSTMLNETTPTIVPSEDSQNMTDDDTSNFILNCSSCFPEREFPPLPENTKYFERFEKIKIMVNVFPQTWRGARESCLRQNSTLVRFTNESQSTISELLERKFGANAWMYWVDKPEDSLSWYHPMAKRIPIPSWLLNGREVQESTAVSSTEECYFLDANKVIMKALSCRDYAGFICESSISE